MGVLITLTDVEPAVRLNALLEADGIETTMVSPLDDLPSEIARSPMSSSSRGTSSMPRR